MTNSKLGTWLWSTEEGAVYRDLLGLGRLLWRGINTHGLDYGVGVLQVVEAGDSPVG